MDSILGCEKNGMDPRISEIAHQSYFTYIVFSEKDKMEPIVSTALTITTDYIEFKRLGIMTNDVLNNKDMVLFHLNFVKKV